MKKPLNPDAVVRNLNAYQIKLTLEYKNLYTNDAYDANDRKILDKLNEMVIDWSNEEPGSFRGWHFGENQKHEIEVKRFFIKVYEEIKHLRGIPFELKPLALEYILKAFERHIEYSYELDYIDLEVLNDKINFALDAFEEFIHTAPNSIEFEKHSILVRNCRIKILESMVFELDKVDA